MRVLVTGGAGFIGSYVVDLLIENGYSVNILDNLDQQIHGNKKPDYLNEKANLINGDILNKDAWMKALENIDAVVHLAAMTGIGQSMYQPSRYMNVNAGGTAEFYDILVKNPEIRKNIKSIVAASSKTVYGEGSYECKEHGIVYPGLRTKEQLERKDWEIHCPVCNEYVKPVGITEDKPVQNLSVYAVTKYITERLCLMYGDIFEIPTTVFRYFSGYGPRQSLSNPYTGVCSIFISRVKNKQSPVIYEDGKQLRDFIYAEDIAKTVLLALEKAKKTNVYNGGSGVPTSIYKIAEMIINILDVNINPSITKEYRIGDTRNDFADISKIQKDFGFKPTWGLKQGLEKLIEWSETQEAVDKFEKAEKERMILKG